MPPGHRDRAALALDVVVGVSIAIAAVRWVELVMTPDLLVRAVGYGVGLGVAVALWIGWRRWTRPDGPRGPSRPHRLAGYAVAFTAITGSLFFIGDQPLPLPLFVVGLIMLLRSFRARAALLAVALLLVLQAVFLLGSGRSWHHTWTELVASAFVFGCGLLVAWLFAEIDRQRRETEALAEEVRRRAGTEAEVASLRERQRSARDLHDGIGHEVTVIMMSLQFAERMRDREPHRAWAEVVRAREQAARALDDIRRLARALHPRGVSGPGIADLSALAESFAGTGLALTVDDRSPELELPEDLAVFRQRFVQEALTNVVRHSTASTVTVSQRLCTEGLVLAVFDNGAIEAEVRPGFGLRSLAERAAELGGSTTVRSGPVGLQLTAVLPVDAPAP